MTTDGEEAFMRGQVSNSMTAAEAMFYPRPKSNQALRQQPSMEPNQPEANKFKSVMQNAAMQPMTRKEIARDIFLEKELDTTK